MRGNPWLYHYYTVHSKLQFGLTAYEAHSQPPQQPQQPQAGARLPSTPLSGGLQYYAGNSTGKSRSTIQQPDLTPACVTGQPLSGSMAQGSPHLTQPLASYETVSGGYAHQTQQVSQPVSALTTDQYSLMVHVHRTTPPTHRPRKSPPVWSAIT